MKASVFLLSLFFWSANVAAQGTSFIDKQKRYPRVRKAFAEKTKSLQEKFNQAKALYPPKSIFIRAFKNERRLELWAENAQSKMVRVLFYPFCDASGVLGPKRKEGDLQVPEGFYYIDRFNPRSNFFLSLGLNYPNHSDRKFADPKQPGSNIFIHGDCVSIGCIAITDAHIKELYSVAVMARHHGQIKIPVHIFPRHMNSAGMNALQKQAKDLPRLWAFWKSLQGPYEYFEKNKILPRLRLDQRGYYRIR